VSRVARTADANRERLMRRLVGTRAVLVLNACLLAAAFAGCGGTPEVSHPPNGVTTGGSAGSGGAGGSGATGGTTIINPGGGQGNEGGGDGDPCDGPNPPSGCFDLMPSGPACGDGELNQDSEECDDGNSLPGDGCSGVCAVEMYFRCDEPGKPCESTIRCGDGQRDPGEVCDDGNTDDGDGCSADCLSSDASYVCPTPGEPCILLYKCGDGRVNGSETCDDGNDADGDGCSAKCKREDGYACGKPNKPCTKLIVCGDGVLEGTEQCDDGNADGGDGCSPQCFIEANFDCTTTQGEKSVCHSTVACGDGVVSGTEVCDDGGTADGDGCSGDCMGVEDGYACARPGYPCQTICGDGRVRGDEQCDDDNTTDGDGCSAGCTIEDGSVCTVSASATSVCSTAVCGNGNDAGAGQVSTEPCDDQNHDWGDGCTPTCSKEPSCANGSACTSACGDGIKFPSEACDDGNNTDGDGCSSTCTIEEGYSCTTNGASPALLNLPMMLRDFKPSAPFTETADTGISTGDGDFQWGGFGNADPDGNIADNWTNYPTLPGAGDAFGNGSILGTSVTLGGTGGMEYGFVQDTLSASKKPLFKWADSEVKASGSLCPLGFGALIRNANNGGGVYCVRQVQNATSFSR